MQRFDVALRYVLNKIWREEQIQRPAERHAELLFQNAAASEIDAPPQKPSDEPGKTYAENSGHASATANGGELAKRREHERLLRRAADDSHYVFPDLGCLTDCVLRCGRVWLAGFAIENPSTVTHCPHARKVRHFEILIDHEATLSFLQGKLLSTEAGVTPAVQINVAVFTASPLLNSTLLPE